MMPGRRARVDGVVVIVTEMISPYRIPVFNALAGLLDGRLRVFFLSERAGRAWPVYESEIAFDYEVLPGKSWVPPRGSGPLYLNVPVATRMRRLDVRAAFVGGYNHLEFPWTALHAWRHAYPLILWSESVSALGGGKPVRSAAKRLAVRACDGWLVPGRRARRQMELLGADPQRIWVAPNAVDVGFWGDGASPRSAGVGGARLLFVGQLSHRKGLDVLLAALDDDAVRNLPLDVVGQGPELGHLEASARSRGLSVTFHGHLDREELRERYRAADVLVFPTRGDPWGLILNEAMSAGCVPVSSSAAGAVDDLVAEGVTGAVVPPDNAEELRRAILELSGDPAGRARLSAAAMERASASTPERCAAGFIEALEGLA
jgi:glycosyltransferase involved in cell wall biosynthesis